MFGRAVATVATVTPLSYIATVHADDGAPRRVKVSQLPLYGSPDTPEYEAVQEKQNRFQEFISNSRKSVWGTMDATQERIDNIKQKYETGKAHTNELLHYIQEDSGMLSRAGIITVAGLGGLVAGYKGGVMKRVLYCGVGMGAASAVCYPRQVLDVGKSGFQEVKGHAVGIWQNAMESKPQPPPKQEQTKTEVVKAEKEVKVDESKMDHGMSKQEDKDMYTTRSG